MPARRFFVEGVRASGDLIDITGGDAHKIAHVLRLRDGDALEVVDSAGAVFTASILSHGGGIVQVSVHEALTASIPSNALRIDVAQGVPRGQKMDFIVEKATELGANAILPFVSERSVAHDIGAAKIDRWRRLAKTAAQQCGRRTIPAVEPVLAFVSLLERFRDYDAVLFPWELAPQVPLRESLPSLLREGARVLVVIGPEGGFSHQEADAATGSGAHLLWLGHRILRTETAALALLAVIDALV